MFLLINKTSKAQAGKGSIFIRARVIVEVQIGDVEVPFEFCDDVQVDACVPFLVESVELDGQLINVAQNLIWSRQEGILLCAF